METAISAATRAWRRNRWRTPDDWLRPPSLNVSLAFARGARPGGRKPNPAPWKERKPKIKPNHAETKADLSDPGHQIRRHERDQKTQPPNRQEQSKTPACHRQHHALGEQVPGDSHPTRPQGYADLNLLSPRRRARQEHIGDVGARDPK